MNNVGQKYLPIGTVVMLKEGTKRVMITGFCSMAAEDQSVMYDYAGCLYPEGFLSSDQTALFNHDQIATIYHMGLVDEEEKTFKTQLNMLVAQMNNTAVEQPVAPVTPAVPVAPVTQVQSVSPATPEVIDVPPVGPGLPGYVAPVTPVASVAPVQPQSLNGFQFDANGNVIAAPTEQPASPTPGPSNIQFDENGTVVSA